MDIEKLIHAVDPYNGGEFDLQERDLRGWGGHSEFFDRIVEHASPRLVVEVGTWKGKSACAMGHALDDVTAHAEAYPHLPRPWHEQAKIVCVDTWLGAPEFWVNHDDEKRYKSMQLKLGYPQVYYTFLSNVVHEGLCHRIVPFPQTSLGAAQFFREKGIRADLIYIDGAHDYKSVKDDLDAWHHVLAPGGTIFGDDYCKHWSGVIHAVDDYAYFRALEVQTFKYDNAPGDAVSDYWVISDRKVAL